MLKWTSKSSFGHNSNAQHDHISSKSPITDVPEKESLPPKRDSTSIQTNKLTHLKQGMHSFHGTRVNLADGLPFSYTDPLACHKPEYPFLIRPQLQKTNETKTDLPKTKTADSPPYPASLKPGKSLPDEFSRSKSMPRLGSPVSSGSSLGGPKKGILAKMKNMFRRSKAETAGERRSVSQPASPNTLKASSKTITKPGDPDTTESNGLLRSGLHPSKSKRRVDLWRRRRKRNNAAKMEGSNTVNDRSSYDIGGPFDNLLVDYKDNGWNPSTKLDEDHYEGYSQRQQNLEPTFETFKASTPLYSDSDIEEGLREASGFEITPIANDEVEIQNRHSIYRDYIPDTREPRLYCPVENVSPATNDVMGFSTFDFNQTQELRKSVSDLQTRHTEKNFIRPRTSYSRSSILAGCNTATNSFKDATLVDVVYNSPVFGKLCVPLPFDGGSREIPQVPFATDDIDHEMEPKFETKYNTECKVVNTRDLKTWTNLWEGKEIVEENLTEAADLNKKSQRDWVFEIPQTNLYSISSNSGNIDWSEEGARDKHLSEKDYGVESDACATYTSLLQAEANSSILKSIGISDSIMNDECKTVFDSAVHKETLDRYQRHGKVNDIEYSPIISSASNSAFSCSSSVSFEGSNAVSGSPTANLHQTQSCHSKSSTKNNNNGHSALREKIFQLKTADNCDASLLVDTKNEDIEQTEVSEKKQKLHTNYVVGIVKQDNVKPEMHEDDTKSISCSPVQRVRSIVHQLEEKIKMKVQGQTGAWVNNVGFQGLDFKSKRGSARASLSFSAVNEQLLQHKHIVNRRNMGGAECVEVDSLEGRHNFEDNHVAIASESDLSYSSIEKVVKIQNYPFTQEHSPQQMNTCVIPSSCGGTSHSEIESPSCDTHSICSDIDGGLSSDQGSNINSVSSDNEHSHEKEMQGEGKPSSDIAMKESQDEAQAAIFTFDKTHDDKGVDKCLSIPRPVSDDPDNSLNASPILCDEFGEKGIMDVTPPCELVRASGSNTGFEKGLFDKELRDELEIPQLQQHMENPVETFQESGAKENNHETNIKATKKLDSILSPARKPPSPIKKTVSFKLDRSLTPSTSQSTFSDDVAICEAIPPKGKQKSAEVKQNKTQPPPPPEAGLSDRTESIDEEGFEEQSARYQTDDSALKVIEISPPSLDDLSWLEESYEGNVDCTEENLREKRTCGLGEQVCKDSNMSDLSYLKGEQETNSIVLSTDPIHFVENNGAITLPTIEKLDDLIKLTSIKELVPENGAQKVNQLLSKSEQDKQGKRELDYIQEEEIVVPQSQEKYQRDDAQKKNDALTEVSESRSDPLTYSVNKEPVNTLNDTPFNDSQDDNIDGLLVDEDVSSALSDLVDQVESLGSKSSPKKPPIIAERVTPLSKENEKDKTAKEESSGLPFWEKKRSPKIPVLKKKLFPLKNVKNRASVVKHNTFSGRNLLKKGPLSLGNKPRLNKVEERDVKPKPKVLKYRLVKAPVKNPEELPVTVEKNREKRFDEKTASQGGKKNSSAKDSDKQGNVSRIPRFMKKQSPEKQHPFSSQQGDLGMKGDNVKRQRVQLEQLSRVSPPLTNRVTKLGLPGRVDAPSVSFSKTKPNKGQPSKTVENSKTATPSPKYSKKEPQKIDSPKQTQSPETGSQHFEVPKADHEPFSEKALKNSKSTIPSRETQNLNTDDKFNLWEPTDYSNRGSPIYPCVDLNLSPDIQGVDINDGFSSESSDQTVAMNGDLAKSSTLQKQNFQDSSQSEDETDDSCSESLDDLTYDVHKSGRGIRNRQCPPLNFRSDIGIDFAGQQKRYNDSTCPYNHTDLRPDQDDHQDHIFDTKRKAQPQRRIFASKKQEASKSRSKYQAHMTKATDPARDTSPNAAPDSKPGEWMFIATFFLLQILLHWVHSTNK